jgi:hypothetical protein
MFPGAWLGFGHFEADECGTMNERLAAAPAAQLTHGMVGCRVAVSDRADREPRLLSDGEVIDIGGRPFRYIDTPHVPHGWDAGVMFEETTGTLIVHDAGGSTASVASRCALSPTGRVN